MDGSGRPAIANAQDGTSDAIMGVADGGGTPRKPEKANREP